jgi:hypothetical protein
MICKSCKKGTLIMMKDCQKCNYCLNDFDKETPSKLYFRESNSNPNELKFNAEQLKFMRMRAMKRGR